MEPVAKTPPLKDKRLWLSVGTIVALLVTHFTGKDLDPELLATIAALVVGYIVPSSMKEASVAKSIARGQEAAAEVKTAEAAVAEINKS